MIQILKFLMARSKITKEKVSSYFSDKGPTYYYSWQIANVNCAAGWTASDHSQKNAVAASQRISIVSGWEKEWGIKWSLNAQLIEKVQRKYIKRPGRTLV